VPSLAPDEQDRASSETIKSGRNRYRAGRAYSDRRFFTLPPPKNFPTPSNGRPRSAASARQPRVNLSHALLYPPNLPREALSAFPALLGRGVELPLVVGYVGWQLVTLPLQGSPLVRGQWHSGR
jgi:hypothetical protein